MYVRKKAYTWRRNRLRTTAFLEIFLETTTATAGDPVRGRGVRSNWPPLRRTRRAALKAAVNSSRDRREICVDILYCELCAPFATAERKDLASRSCLGTCQETVRRSTLALLGLVGSLRHTDYHTLPFGFYQTMEPFACFQQVIHRRTALTSHHRQKYAHSKKCLQE